MLEIEAKARELKHVVDILHRLVMECRLEISGAGIHVQVVDEAHVCMTTLELSSDGFESLDASGDVEIAIDVGKLREFLSLARIGDVVSMRLSEDERHLVGELGNITRRMRLIDPMNLSRPSMPQLNHKTRATVATVELSRIVRAGKGLAVQMRIRAEPDRLLVSAEGDTDSIRLVLDRELMVEYECPEAVQSAYDVEYLSNILAGAPADGNVVLHLGNEYPLRLEHELNEGHWHVVHLLAPRIETGG